MDSTIRRAMERKKQAVRAAFNAAREHAYSVRDQAVAHRLLEEAAVRQLQMDRAIEEMAISPVLTDFTMERALRAMTWRQPARGQDGVAA